MERRSPGVTPLRRSRSDDQASVVELKRKATKAHLILEQCQELGYSVRGSVCSESVVSLQ